MPTELLFRTFFFIWVVLGYDRVASFSLAVEICFKRQLHHKPPTFLLPLLLLRTAHPLVEKVLI